MLVREWLLVVVPRAEQLRIIQRAHTKWQDIYGETDDVETELILHRMTDEALAEAEEKYKDRPANS